MFHGHCQIDNKLFHSCVSFFMSFFRALNDATLFVVLTLSFSLLNFLHMGADCLCSYFYQFNDLCKTSYLQSVFSNLISIFQSEFYGNTLLCKCTQLLLFQCIDGHYHKGTFINDVTPTFLLWLLNAKVTLSSSVGCVTSLTNSPRRWIINIIPV